MYLFLLLINLAKKNAEVSTLDIKTSITILGILGLSILAAKPFYKSQALKKTPLIILLILFGLLLFSVLIGLIFSSLLLAIIAFLLPIFIVTVWIKLSRKKIKRKN
jgi:hypothetical protein